MHNKPIFLAKKQGPRGGSLNYWFWQNRVYSHVFFQNETFFSWSSLISWLFILIFQANRARDPRHLLKIANVPNFFWKDRTGTILGSPPPRSYAPLWTCNRFAVVSVATEQLWKLRSRPYAQREKADQCKWQGKFGREHSENMNMKPTYRAYWIRSVLIFLRIRRRQIREMIKMRLRKWNNCDQKSERDIQKLRCHIPKKNQMSYPHVGFVF